MVDGLPVWRMDITFPSVGALTRFLDAVTEAELALGLLLLDKPFSRSGTRFRKPWSDDVWNGASLVVLLAETQSLHPRGRVDFGGRVTLASDACVTMGGGVAYRVRLHAGRAYHFALNCSEACRRGDGALRVVAGECSEHRNFLRSYVNAPDHATLRDAARRALG